MPFLFIANYSLLKKILYENYNGIFIKESASLKLRNRAGRSAWKHLVRRRYADTTQQL